MKILDVIKSLHELRENIVIGLKTEKKIVNKYYKDASSKHFKYILCGEIAELFKVKLEIENSLKGVRRIFIWSDYLINQFDYVFDSKYINAVVEEGREDIIEEYEQNILFDADRKGTHAVLELLIDNKTYIIDPTVGIIYPNDIETLITQKNSRNAYKFMDQYKYIMDSIHMVRPYMFIYTTPTYWSHIQSWHYRDTPLVNESVLNKYLNYFQK